VAKRDFLQITDFSRKEVEQLFDLAKRMKARAYRETPLAGKTLAMIFAKSSTRTRVSFEVGAYQLGGRALFLSSKDIQIGRGEPIPDTARVLSRYVDGIMIRTYDHAEVEELARFSTIPVINGLTDLTHPCQVLADLFTVKEHLGGWEGKRIAWVGDGNNMAHSLMFGAPKVGMNIVVATPQGYEPNPQVVAQATADAKAAGTKITVTHSIEEAVDDADIIETDVWASMGQEEESEKRRHDFAGWQVDKRVMSLARKNAIFMHCLPAHRGEEVAAEVIDGKQSVIFDEAENRLHVQKAIMVMLMKGRKRSK